MTNRIRIIKPAERDAQRDSESAAAKQKDVPPSEVASSKDTAKIVTSWIREFRQRKSMERAAAYIS